MTVTQMRYEILQVYNGRYGWAKKVQAMDDDQVIAIYYDFFHRGLFDKPKSKPEPILTHKKSPSVKQLSIFDILNKERGE